MNQNYIIADAWKIIEEGFDKDRVMQSESLFSLGNGAMGQRNTFEEKYSGKTFQGSYIGGVYYPDKTRVGWWKNGYPEYFAKVLNAPNWIGINVRVNGDELDLNTCQEVRNFRRELNMQEGVYRRSFSVLLKNGAEIQIVATRFLSLLYDELGVIRYEVTPLNGDVEVSFESYLDGGVENYDTNWEEKFWDTVEINRIKNQFFITSETKKTAFRVCTFMENTLDVEGMPVPLQSINTAKNYIGCVYKILVVKNQTARFEKFAGYVTSFNHQKEKLKEHAEKLLKNVVPMGFEKLLEFQKNEWQKIWEMSDITIEGDIKAQQAIRFNIFQLNQTYSGKDPRLNIGPKGFTGEKYGGSTYWDTEAYCLPFYMATKNQEVARNLLKYRYNHLEKAIENAQKLGFTSGAALYPMVTMNGEECHNEWEITFEEIHRNGAIAFAIYNYVRYTGDTSYLREMGIEVLIAIARFWGQRASFSKAKNKFVILGVTGPNEYENNVNNNFYTNCIAKWCLDYVKFSLENLAREDKKRYEQIVEKTELSNKELLLWNEISQKMYFPYDEKLGIYLQQEGFLDKDLKTVADINPKERPINQHWSWDRILRSPYIKQADTLQAFYLFEEHFSKESLENHYNFYEPFTVHESSLSPCVHSILASSLGKMDDAYRFYLRTSRLDLDDYNKEVHEGLHITSMAGTWLSIVEGFGGLRIKNDMLHLTPKIPKEWECYSFKVNFRGKLLKVTVNQQGATVETNSGFYKNMQNNKEQVLEI